jgi:hypothetical protein
VHRAAAGLLAAGISIAALVAPAGAASSGVTAAERTQARHALLVLSDFPHAWRSSSIGNPGSSTDVAGDAQLAHCLGISPSSIEFSPPQISSPSFSSRGATAFAVNSVLVFSSSAMAHNEYAAFLRPEMPHCLSTAISSSSGTTGSTVVPLPHMTFARVSSPKGTVAFGISSSSYAKDAEVVLTFFVHGQFGDVTAIYGLGTKVALVPLAQRLLGVERSKL